MSIYYQEHLVKIEKMNQSTCGLKAKWNWTEFTKLSNELKSKLDHTRTDENGGAQYVFGGRTYNWAYGFIGANGGRLVDDQFNTYLTSKPVLDALEYLGGLYGVEGYVD